jgi:hypothetical protein
MAKAAEKVKPEVCRETPPHKKMPAGNSPLAGDEIVDALTRDAQKRVSGQLVPLFKPVHWQDLSAKTLNRIALTRYIGGGFHGFRSKIFREAC